MVASAQALAIPTGVVCPEFSAKWKVFLSISQGPQWITSVGQLSAFVGNTSLGSISRGWGRLLETVVTSTGFVRPKFSAKWKLFLSISKEPQRITSVYQLSAFVGNIFLGASSVVGLDLGDRYDSDRVGVRSFPRKGGSFS